MVDEEIFVTKLEHIEEYVEDLEAMRGISRTAYSDDTVVQRAVERTLMNLVQACIDVAGHVRRARNSALPTPRLARGSSLVRRRARDVVSRRT